MSQPDDNIITLDAIDHIRMRPGMYIPGGRNREALHHLIFELIEDAEVGLYVGLGNSLTVTLLPDNFVIVSDNGAGMPVEIVENTKKSKLEIIFTVKSRRGQDGSYIILNAGLMGVGPEVVNALSEELVAEVKRDGHLWRQTYNKGRTQTPLTKVRELEAGEATGTTITFKPDYTIFEPNEFDYQLLCERFSDLAVLLPTAIYTVRDERVQPPLENSYHIENGLLALLEKIAANLLHPLIHIKHEIPTEPKSWYWHPFPFVIEIAFQYCDTTDNRIISFANTIRTDDGGVHVNGFVRGLGQVLARYAREHQLRPRNANPFTPQQAKAGFFAIVKLQHPDPQFESQTKIRLLNKDVEEVIEPLVTEEFSRFAEANPDAMRRIVENCVKWRSR